MTAGNHRETGSEITGVPVNGRHKNNSPSPGIGERGAGKWRNDEKAGAYFLFGITSGGLLALPVALG